MNLKVSLLGWQGFVKGGGAVNSVSATRLMFKCRQHIGFAILSQISVSREKALTSLTPIYMDAKFTHLGRI
jgi:hypothetical protein